MLLISTWHASLSLCLVSLLGMSGTSSAPHPSATTTPPALFFLSCCFRCIALRAPTVSCSSSHSSSGHCSSSSSWRPHWCGSLCCYFRCCSSIAPVRACPLLRTLLLLLLLLLLRALQQQQGAPWGPPLLGAPAVRGPSGDGVWAETTARKSTCMPPVSKEKSL